MDDRRDRRPALVDQHEAHHGHGHEPGLMDQGIPCHEGDEDQGQRDLGLEPIGDGVATDQLDEGKGHHGAQRDSGAQRLRKAKCDGAGPCPGGHGAQGQNGQGGADHVGHDALPAKEGADRPRGPHVVEQR